MSARFAVTDENRRWWTLAAMCFALFMVMLDNTAVNVALPSIQDDLQTSVAGLQWTVTAYTLAFGVLIVTGGRLGDIFGRRRVFLIGVVIFAASSLFIGFSQSSAWLVSGRAVQGVGAALMMPATLSIITNVFPAHERGRAIGTWAGVSALALAIGPVVGGLLVEHVSWQSIFFVNVPVAAVAVVVTLFAARESRDETVLPTVDYAGVAAITIGLTALTLALVEAGAWGWTSARVLGLFAVAAIGLTLFAHLERRVKVPMIDFSFFASRTFLGANIVAFVISFAMLGMFFFLTLYMQNVLRYSPLETGLRFLPTTLMVILIAPIAGRLTDRIGPRPLVTMGLALVAISLTWQSFITPTSSFGFLLPAFVLMGLGIALTMSPMSTAAMNAIDESKAGVASGILSMNRRVGGTLGVALLGAFIGQTSSQADFVDSLGRGLLMTALLAAAGAVVAWKLISPELAGGAVRPAPPTGEVSPPPAEPAARERVGA